MARPPRTLDQSNYEVILIEKRDDGVALITLNRPERHNAVGGPMHTELWQLPGDIQDDPDVRVAVITGAGRSFCSGADIQASFGDASRDPALPLGLEGEARNIVDGFLRLDKPVITAVKGYALGLGATVALLGDIVLAGKSIRIGDTHVVVGITAGDGGAVLWPSLVGPQAAKYYLFTGEHVDAETAERLGLVFRVYEDDDLVDEALAMAARIASGAPYAIRTTKRAINRNLERISQDVMPFSLAVEGLAMKTEDQTEAVTAFAEKRQAQFQGR
jgi:enoyl-CoA hydratase